MPAHAAGDQVMEVAEKLPATDHQAVQPPQIEVLPAMDLQPPLMGGEPGQEADLDIDVAPRDVNIGVVGDVVLPVPQVRAASDQIQGQRHQSVDPLVPRNGVMRCVVLNV